jgi:ketosteroid isomerase-like protein
VASAALSLAVVGLGFKGLDTTNTGVNQSDFLAQSDAASGSGSSTVAAVPLTADQSAIEQVIQQSNNEQAQALSSGDPTVMQDTSTSSHYQELIQTNQDLTSGGVTGLKLVNLSWGQVNVSGTTATATDYETWSISFSDGTTQQARNENDYTLVQQNGSWKIQKDDSPQSSSGSGSSSPSTSTSPAPQGQQPPSGRSTGDDSLNWSGYAATSGTFTGVSGTWTVPPFSPDSTPGIDATWVGIGGANSNDLIQAGTDEEVDGGGTTEYEAWIETLPRAAQTVPLSVNPGDSVTVNLTQTAKGTWDISIKNNTTGQNYDKSVQYNSSLSSAEWIEEAPTGVRSGILPLDDFGTVSFTNATTVQNGQTVSAQQAGATPITMANQRGQVLATASALGGDGKSFTVSRAANTQPTQTSGRGNGSGSTGRGSSGRGSGLSSNGIPSTGSGWGYPSTGSSSNGRGSSGWGLTTGSGGLTAY